MYNFLNCIGINGKNLGATKPDLVDRGLVIEHTPIPKPELLGYIFGILSKSPRVSFIYAKDICYQKVSFIYTAAIPVTTYCSAFIADAVLFIFFLIHIFLRHSSHGYANVSHSLPTYALYNHILDTVWFSFPSS
jgi:hypothetical protein